jgi:hypothetical protein
VVDISPNVKIKKVTKIELGASSVDKETLENIVGVDYRPIHPDHTPQTVMSTVNPTGWNKPHKWLKFTIQCLGNVYHPIFHNGSGNVAYYSYTTDNPALPYLEFFLEDENGGVWTVTVTGAIVNRVYDALADDRTPLTIIEILAYSMTPLTPP